MAEDTNAPVVIIKRKKVVKADGHHGGAWKVAYADFVTAMMAFFMLMWLLGATTEKQRKGIADYFSPTISIVKASAGGTGAFNGDSVLAEGNLAQNGTGAPSTLSTRQNRSSGNLGQERGSEDTDDISASQSLAAVDEALRGLSGESMVSELLRRHIVTRLSDEGLVIELFATRDTPLFDEAGVARPVLTDLLETIAPVLGIVRNDIALHGHVSRSDESADGQALGNWEMSAIRADTTRRTLKGAGLAPDRIARVTGFADRQPVTDDAGAPRNDRVEVVVLRDKL